jgi:hypothetical protein
MHRAYVEAPLPVELPKIQRSLPDLIRQTGFFERDVPLATETMYGLNGQWLYCQGLIS